MKLIESIKKLRRGWVLLVGLSALLVFSIKLLEVTGMVDQALFQARWDEKLVMVDLLCDDLDFYVEQDQDWGYYDYLDGLIVQIQRMDAAPRFYARLFNDNLEPLSESVFIEGDVPIPTLADDHIREFVTTTRDRGQIRTQFVNENGHSEWIQMYYRWIPTGQDYLDRSLLLCAMRETPLNGEPSTILAKWCAALIAVTGLIIIIAGIQEVLGNGGQRLSGSGGSSANGVRGRAGQNAQHPPADGNQTNTKPDVCSGVHGNTAVLAAGYTQYKYEPDVCAGGDSGMDGTASNGSGNGAAGQENGAET